MIFLMKSNLERASAPPANRGLFRFEIFDVFRSLLALFFMVRLHLFVSLEHKRAGFRGKRKKRGSRQSCTEHTPHYAADMRSYSRVGGFLLLAFSYALVLIACSRVAPPADPLTENPKRIVCATPALVEIVFALGAGDRVIAISEYTVYPPEALALPRIGGWMDPNREQIIALRADLLLTQGEHPALAAFAEANRLPLRSFRIESLQDVESAIRSLGVLLGVPQNAEHLIAHMQDERARMASVLQGRPPVRAALLMGRLPNTFQGMTTVGDGTFLDELLVLAGGSNIFADATGSYPQISKESLLARNPDVIMEINPEGWPPRVREEMWRDWMSFGKIRAVDQKRVYFLEDDFLLIPGPRVGEIARRFLACLHPDIEFQ